MKFLEWVESVDYLIIPLLADVALSVFSAGLATAVLRYVFELAI
jgi:hypothetical protein